MTYATQADMVERFGEGELIDLTDRNHTGAIDATVLGRALADATAEIDGYLASRYDLPLASTPVVLVRVCADLARYYLHDDHAPEQVTERHKAAVALLRRISDGQVSLGASESGGTPTTNNGAEMAGGGRIWGRDNSKGFM
ncbi:MAG: phage protein Gp36 family protein [Marinobacter sp.]|uniref:gp436 family protein n=1 Tax=Marinobacter sp. TaxID=50741 RepID=UPI00299E035A|nr:phage protein Gp36 family protein [Marinobacter sp.]MDX1755883.1 phage protein Gp36 family protein [Marinobacter sp.]